MKSLRKAYRGEEGFTLVELLVVVVILGVLAAVAVLAVTRFMGEGRLEAAQTELHQAQTAIAAAMSDESVATVTDATSMTFGPDHDLDVDGDTVGDCQEFLHGPLTATYDVDSSGNIIDANDEDEPFGTGIIFNTTTCQWEEGTLTT